VNAQDFALDGGGCGCTLQTWNLTDVITGSSPELNRIHSWQYSPVIESASWYVLYYRDDRFDINRFDLSGGPGTLTTTVVYTEPDVGADLTLFASINFNSRPAPGPLVSMHKDDEGNTVLRTFSYNTGGTTFTLEGTSVSSAADNGGYDETFISANNTRVFGNGDFLDVWDIDPLTAPNFCARYVIPDQGQNAFSVVWYEEADGIIFLFEREAPNNPPILHRLFVVDVDSDDPCDSITIIATIEVTDLPFQNLGRSTSANMQPEERALYLGGSTSGSLILPLFIVTFNESWIPLDVFEYDEIRNYEGVPVGFAGWNKQIVLAPQVSSVDEEPVIANVSLYCIRENVTNPELITTTIPASGTTTNVTDLSVFPQFSLETLAAYGWSTQHQIFVASASNVFDDKLMGATGVIQMSFCGDGIENTEREGEWPDSCVEGLQCDYPELPGTGNATCCDTDTCQALEDKDCGEDNCCIVNLPVDEGTNLDTGSCGDGIPSNTTVCRNATGPCDMDTFYNGINCTCPLTKYFPNTTECFAEMECSEASFCTGNSSQCPDPVFFPNGTICSPGAGPCAANSTCTGNSSTCPSDGFLSNTTICRPSNGTCQLNATCTGMNSTCPANEFISNGTICNPSNGTCQLNATCTGFSAPCPENEFLSNTTICDASDGPCENNATCTGDSATCPPKEFVSNTTICDESGGVCQSNATCTGNNATCPTKEFLSNTTECFPEMDCSEASFCVGNSTECPDPVFLPNGTVCSPGAGPCENNATCTGNNSTCPPDGFLSNTTICRTSNGTCQLNATCTGFSAPCPENEFLSNTTICDASDGPCENNATCTGFSAPCPPKEFLSNTTICDESGGVCQTNATCSGNNATCPMKEFLTNTTECLPEMDCSEASFCMGNSTECPDPAFFPNGTICSPGSGPCESNSTCTGNNSTCPPDGFLPSGTICDASDGACQTNATCSGVSADCPAKQFLPDTTICDESSGVCQTNATCPGNNATCPPKEFLTNTTECLPSEGCNEPAFCAGDDVDCPDPSLFPNGTVCRPSGGDCENASVCEGETTCPPNPPAPAGTVCGSLVTLPFFCELQGACNGISTVCQGGGPKPPGTPCDADGDPCHISECNADGVCVVVSDDGCIEPVFPVFPNDTTSEIIEPGSGFPAGLVIGASIGLFLFLIFAILCCLILFLPALRRGRRREGQTATAQTGSYSPLSRESI